MWPRLLAFALLALCSAAHAVNPHGYGTGSGGNYPPLTPGVWSNVSPSVTLTLTGHYGIATFEVSPADSTGNTIYVCIDQDGLYRSTNRGLTWVKTGSVFSGYSGGSTSTYLDSPVRVLVDPSNGNHLIASQGVRGATIGFWVSTDGGANWTIPAGFSSLVASTTTNDVTTMVVEPGNFNHILLGSHSLWHGSTPPGVMESTDGGNTWVAHNGDSSWPAGSMGLGFLEDAHSGQGNSSTWWGGTDGDGFWYTTNAGTSWTKASGTAFDGSSPSVPHGGSWLFYAPNGTLYTGGVYYPWYSTNNGASWTSMSSNSIGYSFYSTIWGDGTTLFTSRESALDGMGFGSYAPFVEAPDGTGTSATWTTQPGGQTFFNGPFMMQYDSTNGILYASMWTQGFWALKTP